MLISGQVGTYPSPNPTLTFTCFQLIVVGAGRDRDAIAFILTLIHNYFHANEWTYIDTLVYSDTFIYKIVHSVYFSFRV